jgi:hypothetical protein
MADGKASSIPLPSAVLNVLRGLGLGAKLRPVAAAAVLAGGQPAVHIVVRSKSGNRE